MKKNQNSSINLNKSPLTAKQISHFHKKVAAKVAKIRRQKGVSQLDLSLAIGYKSVSLVAGAEAGYKNIHFNLEQLYRIANALEVDIAEFFEFE